MKVNMTPNPLDVVTIHASQGDTEARQWEFELHNNGELIDTSEITEQLFFKAYKGGTEQILPENTSTPTTSPFKGDIKYPQGLLIDQEFIYRQSPTEEDGLAKITDIKGNTLNWNQQMDSSLYRTGTYSDVAVTKSADETYLVANGTASATAYIRLFNVASFPMISGHKYCCVVPNDSDVAYYDDSSPRQYSNQYSSFMFTSNGNPIRPHARINQGIASTNRRISFMMFDLTQMGLDSLTVDDFTSLFPLPYYAYNQGSLLSFNGEQIKTVGKNQSQLVSMSTISGGYINASSGNIATVKKGITYTLSFDNLTASTANIVARLLVNGTWMRQGEKNLIANSRWDLTFTATDDGVLGLSAGLGSQYSEVKVFDNIQLEFGSTATSYEPYTSSTLSLPISTYFPTGMKSAETVYDELTNEKAAKRLETITFDGSENWALHGSIASWFYIDGYMTDAKFVNDTTPLKNRNTGGYEAVGYTSAGSLLNMQFTFNPTSGTAVSSRTIFKNTSCTTVDQWKAYLQSHPLTICYELATPTETSFTTASLVTENAEIPLSNNDGTLIGKCTEELSAEPGFHDAKIKLSDSDGECYSNKIQLHVERSPQ